MSYNFQSPDFYSSRLKTIRGIRCLRSSNEYVETVWFEEKKVGFLLNSIEKSMRKTFMICSSSQFLIGLPPHVWPEIFLEEINCSSWSRIFLKIHEIMRFLCSIAKLFLFECSNYMKRKLWCKKKEKENRKYYNWFRYELFNDKKQIFLDNNHIMCESIFLRYKNLSSFCGWIKFDVRFFFRLCRANNYDENYPIARSFNNKWNFSLFVVFFLYYIFIIFLTYVSSYIDQIWIKFELKN